MSQKEKAVRREICGQAQDLVNFAASLEVARFDMLQVVYEGDKNLKEIRNLVFLGVDRDSNQKPTGTFEFWEPQIGEDREIPSKITLSGGIIFHWKKIGHADSKEVQRIIDSQKPHQEITRLGLAF